MLACSAFRCNRAQVLDLLARFFIRPLLDSFIA